ncbi:MAG: UbiX family flavin prenyltransferase [Gemmatimonadota bacterium]
MTGVREGGAPESGWIVGITGASGAPYAVRLLEVLAASGEPADVIVSSHGWRLLRHECGLGDEEALRGRVGDGRLRFFDNGNRGARPASGSARYRGLVICPCSMATASAIAHGSSRSLIERAADVILKERRRLIVVPRETPLSTVHLRNLLTLSRLGAVVLPAAPGFYHDPRTTGDLVDFVVARVLDHMDVPHDLGRRWTGEEEADPPS